VNTTSLLPDQYAICLLHFWMKLYILIVSLINFLGITSFKFSCHVFLGTFTLYMLCKYFNDLYYARIVYVF
jgi:antibiotic biosynthesis monooxygenase (ABM) superfamily enzyme